MNQKRKSLGFGLLMLALFSCKEEIIDPPLDVNEADLSFLDTSQTNGTWHGIIIQKKAGNCPIDYEKLEYEMDFNVSRPPPPTPE